MRKKLAFLAGLLACLCLPTGCILLPTPQTPGEDSSTTADDRETEDSSLPENFKFYHPNTTYTYRTAVNESRLATALDPNYLILANKSHALGESYAPEKTVTLSKSITVDKDILLETRAAEALTAMMAELRADGITDLMVTSGYRTYAYQVSLFNHYLDREQNNLTAEAEAYFGEGYINEHYRALGLTGLSPSDARQVVLSYSALPGTSEHQTGLCVDFITADMTGLTTDFETTEAFAWLTENAYRFGFVLRYPKNGEAVTGYTYEPWHFRFVGREAATDLHFSGLTLEEYLTALEHLP